MLSRIHRVIATAKSLDESRAFYRRYIVDLQAWGRRRLAGASLVRRACPVCGGMSTAPVFQAPVYAFFRCLTCRLVFVRDVLPDTELDAFYEDNEIYRAIWDHEYREVLERKDQPTHGVLVDLILRHRPGDEACLDIGCGHGKLLSEMAPHFRRAEGIELNATAAQRGREIFGLQIHSRRLEHLDLPSSRFDAIVLNQVIEHLNDLELFQDIRRILKPGGIVYLGCPHLDSLSMRLLQRRHIHVSTHVHVNFFGRSAIEALARRFQLEPILITADDNLDLGLDDLVDCWLDPPRFIHRTSHHPHLWPLSLATRASLHVLRRSGLPRLLHWGSYLRVVLGKRD